MICKKCGSNIADTSKFCGYCGAPVDQLQPSQPVPNLEFDQQDNLKPVNLDQTDQNITNKVDNITESVSPINFAVNNLNNDLNKTESTLNSMNIGPSGVQKVDNPINVQNTNINSANISNQLSGSTSPGHLEYVSQNLNNSVSTPLNVDKQINTSSPIINKPIAKNKQGDKKVGLLILGVVIVLIGLVILITTFIFKTSSSSVNVLSKALYNLKQTAFNSGTIDALVSIENKTDDPLNFSATIKYEKNDDGYNMNFILNKSLLYDEMNFYSKVSGSGLSLYIPSTAIDLTGLTYSNNNIWVSYVKNLEIPIQNLENELKIEDIIDEKHFIYVSSTNGIKHYKLIVDNELIKKMESVYKKTLEDEKSEMNDEIFKQTNITDKYEVDFYINGSNELEKISLNISDFDSESDISKIIISLEFENFDSTSVLIPNDIVNSSISLEDYVDTYPNESSKDKEDTIDEVNEI